MRWKPFRITETWMKVIYVLVWVLAWVAVLVALQPGVSWRHSCNC